MLRFKILIVEDEPNIQELLTYNLNDYSLLTADNGLEAWDILQDEKIDLVLLDINIPGINGYDLCKKIRNHESTASVPVIFLTAKTTEEDLLYGFNLGADDYIKKPFSIMEVKARIKSVLNRFSFVKDVYKINDLELNFNSYTVKIKNDFIKLTTKEFKVLSYLIEKKNKAISRYILLEHIWGSNTSSGPRSVDVIITRLRDKLNEYGTHIRTITNFGYQWNEVQLN